MDISGENQRKKLKTEPKEKPKTYVEKTLEFVPFAEMLATKSGKPGTGITRRTNAAFILVHVLFMFYRKFNRYPAYATRAADQTELSAITEQVVSELGLDPVRFVDKLRQQDAWNNVFGEMAPITAILGGVVGQDMIRTITAHDPPIKNVFLFNGFECSGSIESIGR